MRKLVVWFSEVDKEDIGLVGGKGANLGEMVKANLPIPPGFIITSLAYYEFLDENNLRGQIRKILAGLDVENPVKLHEASNRVKKAILKGKINPELAAKIINYYFDLGKIKSQNKIKKIFSAFVHKNLLVAVRSSATAEDLPDASFAGQQSTFLNIRGEASLLAAVKECWASLFEERAIYYRTQKKFDHFKVGIAVPVQKMVESEKSGIMFTIDPSTNNKKSIIIEGAFGLGEMVVQGEVTPDIYEVNKSDLQVTKITVSSQNKKLVKSEDGNKIVSLSKKEGGRQKLTHKEIIELAKLGNKIEKHYYFPQDIEWAIEKGNIYIVQSRPITTIKAVEKKIQNDNGQFSALAKLPLILTGVPASPGLAVGVCQILQSAHEIGRIKNGDVLVAPMTNPDFVPAMKKACAIVTDYGGKTSHAAIVSRELGIPCVVGTEKATKILKNGLSITVDGGNGKVYKGTYMGRLPGSRIISAKENEDMQRMEQLKTATKVYVNLAEPELAAEIAKRNVDGVGLLRAEFIMAQIGVHPKKMLQQKMRKEFVQQLADNLTKFTESFFPRPVIYRGTDFKTNEYRNLRGGKEFEPEEENPMIGYRGCYRYIKDPAVFEMELEALKIVRNERNFKNLSLMIPFVRTVKELIDVKKIIIDYGLYRQGSFDLYLMVEIPANVILLDQFIDVGIDGVSIGSNDLTMLTLGCDRDNNLVASEYDELNDAVLWSLQHIVTTCKKRKVRCSICGQAPSVYPELTEKLVSWGITSVSISPDMITKTREIIYEAEKKLFK